MTKCTRMKTQQQWGSDPEEQDSKPTKAMASVWPRHTHNTHGVSHTGLRLPEILNFMNLLKSTVQMFFSF